MRELLDSFLANGLADFEGLQISGTIPVKTDLINAIIADFLKPEAAAEPVAESDPEVSGETFEMTPAEISAAAEDVAPVAATPAPAAKPKKISLQKVIKPLIKHVGIRAIEGKIVLEFDVRR